MAGDNFINELLPGSKAVKWRAFIKQAASPLIQLPGTGASNLRSLAKKTPITPVTSFAETPAATVNRTLHGISPDSPRVQMAGAIAAQTTKRPATLQSAYQPTPVSQSLLAKRNAGFPRPQPPPDSSPKNVAYSRNGQAFVTRDINQFPEDARELAANFGQSTIENHEMEHAHRQPHSLFINGKYRGTSAVRPYDEQEVGPSIGDLVFRAEQFAKEEGKPLQHKVELPGGKQHDINWMRQQAQQHGYWDGRSMDDLIFNNRAGQQWYNQMVEGQRRQMQQNHNR